MQNGGNVLNTGRLFINTIIITIALFWFNYMLVEIPDIRLALLIALIGGLLYLFLEIIFVKYVDNFQLGGDNAYKYYSNKNYYTGGNQTTSNFQSGGNNAYRYYDGKAEAGVSF